MQVEKQTEQHESNVLAVLLLAQAAEVPQQVDPVLEFPEAGLDDSAAYEGYRTRFYRDAAGNAFQVYMDGRSGRLVHVWANARNESVGLTARDPDGQPVPLEWASGAWVTTTGSDRTMEYELEAPPAVEFGHFLLGSMRVERDFQTSAAHLEPFGTPPFRLEALERLIDNLGRLDGSERREHLALLDAEDEADLRARIERSFYRVDMGNACILRMVQPSFDARNRLILELIVDRRVAELESAGRVVTLRSLDGGPVRLRVRITTDARALSPLTRHDIFNTVFFRYFEAEREAYETLLAIPESARSADDRSRIVSFRRMERAVRAAELLAYREKIMAGMPNYATYFGRDTLMTALMMEPVWTDAMFEHVIASVLSKLSPAGEVSHEESVGGQAIRENAAVYNALVEEYLRGGTDRDTLLERAREVLADLQAVRENYRMVDDDYQFPILVSRYLADPDIPLERKRAFLEAPARDGIDASRLTLLLRNLAHVARTTTAYVRETDTAHLIGFSKLDDEHWFPGSWRDSGAGYGNGRYAMDVNAIWVPNALEAIGEILGALRELGYGPAELERAAPGIRRSRFAAYARRPEELAEAVRVWRGAARHFEVQLDALEVEARVSERLARMSEAERRHWERVLRADPLEGGAMKFLSIALDAEGRPIPVANTDPVVGVFLGDATRRVLAGEMTPEEALQRLDIVLLPYPIGLMVEGVGPVVSNDSYADRAVSEAFEVDHYHSPTTVWGREVNLLLLGLERQIAAAFDADGRLCDPSLEPIVHGLAAALQRVREAVDASGLSHNELWSYRVVDGCIAPVRYATSTDIQLWNVTDLAVRFRLSRYSANAEAWSTPREETSVAARA